MSATKRTIPGLDDFQIDNVIQTDAAINPGNSGNPLIDAAGRVIGINSQIRTGGSATATSASASPSPSTRPAVVPQLQRSGRVERGYLGVETRTIDGSLADLNLPAQVGALVQTVTPGVPAAKAGVRGGDIMAQLDWLRRSHRRRRHHRCRRPPCALQRGRRAGITAKQGGRQVKIDIMRVGKKRTVEVELAEPPAGGGLAQALGTGAPAAPVGPCRLGAPPRLAPCGRGLDWGGPRPRFKIWGLTPPPGRRAGGRAGGLGARPHPVGGLPAPLPASRGRADRGTLPPPGRGLRRVRQRHDRRGGRRGGRARAHDGAAPRRRGPASCEGAAHRREDRQGSPGELGPTSRRSSGSTRTSTSSTRTAGHCGGTAGRSTGSSRLLRSCVRARPQRRPDARERHDRDRRRPPLRGGFASGTEARPGIMDTRSSGCSAAAVQDGVVAASMSPPPLPTPLRPLRGQYVPETLMPAWPSSSASGSPPPATRASARSSPRLRATRWAPHAAVPGRAPERGGRPRGLAQARGPSCTRGAQAQQRAGPGAARAAHGQAARDGRDRRGPARRGHRAQPRCSTSSASSTWARWTWAARR